VNATIPIADYHFCYSSGQHRMLEEMCANRQFGGGGRGSE
jgi:hypothetical protein